MGYQIVQEPCFDDRNAIYYHLNLSTNHKIVQLSNDLITVGCKMWKICDKVIIWINVDHTNGHNIYRSQFIKMYENSHVLDHDA